MNRSVLFTLLPLLLVVGPPNFASAEPCGGPGCAIAIGPGVGGAVAAGILLVPMAAESVYLARGERPPVRLPIASFVLVSTMVLPSVLLNLVGERTGEAGYWLGGSALMAVGVAGVVMGILSLVKDEGPVAKAEGRAPRWAVTPMFGEVRGASVAIVGF